MLTIYCRVNIVEKIIFLFFISDTYISFITNNKNFYINFKINGNSPI